MHAAASTGFTKLTTSAQGDDRSLPPASGQRVAARWVVAICVVTLLSACKRNEAAASDAPDDAGARDRGEGGSGGRGGAGSDSARTPSDDPLVAIADALCQRHYACAEELDIAVEFPDPEWCRWETLRGDLDMFPNATRPDSMATCDSFPEATTEDASAVIACIEAIALAPCGATSVGENAMKRLRGPCRLAYDSMTSFFPSAKDDGTPCQEDEFCGFDSHCEITDFEEYTGVCAPRTQDAGGPCGGDLLCKRALDCVRETDDSRCTGDPRDEDTCICKSLSELPIHRPLATGNEGDPCSAEDFDVCMPGLACALDAGDFLDTGRCVPIMLGSPCDDHTRCDCRDGVCVQPELGDTCRDDGDCTTAHVCLEGRCTEPVLCGEDGDACDSGVHCASGLVCADEGTCVASPHGPGPGSSGRVLVDASNDGNFWWFRPSDVSPHQGARLAGHMRSLGLDVVEAAQPIDSELLSGFELVIRAGEQAPPGNAVLAAYEAYIRAGGNLLLLADFIRPAEGDALAERLGLVLHGWTRGPQLVEFEADPLTAGMTDGSSMFLAGSGLKEAPTMHRALARLDPASYLDLNADMQRNPGEPSSPVVMGTFQLGEGRVVYVTDLNYLELVPQPLTDNVLRALVPSLGTSGASGTGGAGGSTGSGGAGGTDACEALTCEDGSWMCAGTTTDYCDGIEHCDDESDEQGCGEPCEQGVDCSAGALPTWLACQPGSPCDGTVDCGSGYDEEGCESCSSGFHCTSEARCLPATEVCDGTAQCDEDECGCGGAVDCSDGTCAGAGERCDGSEHCANGADEVGCSGCTGRAFLCAAEQMCLADLRRCDGEPDCSDGADETGCENCLVCDERKDRCVHPDLICDGFQDCGLGEDEQGCN